MIIEKYTEFRIIEDSINQQEEFDLQFGKLDGLEEANPNISPKNDDFSESQVEEIKFEIHELNNNNLNESQS